MNIGPLDRRIEIQDKVKTTHPLYGTEIFDWVTTGKAWANIQDQMPSRDESISSGAVEVSTRRTRVRIRYRPDLKPSHRIKFGDRIMQIVGGPAEIGGRRAFLELMCEEVKTSG